MASSTLEERPAATPSPITTPAAEDTDTTTTTTTQTDTTAEEPDVSPAGPSQPLQHGCDDFWTWNRWEHSPDVKLYGPAHRIAHFHPNWSSGTAGVRGTRVLNNGRYFWELRLSHRIFGTSMMFGIGTKKARLHDGSFRNLLGEDSNGWGLSHKGLIWHGGRWQHYAKPFRQNVPTVVGVLFDGIAGTLTYYKDGECLGVAFRGLQECREPLYPIICSTAAKTEMCLESMKRDFVNLQDRCRAVIVKRIKRKRDLDMLWGVPPRIKYYLCEAVMESKGGGGGAGGGGSSSSSSSTGGGDGKVRSLKATCNVYENNGGALKGCTQWRV